MTKKNYRNMKEFIEKSLKSLAAEKEDDKKIFCSEADFQFALAMKLKEIEPSLKIRLEKPHEVDCCDENNKPVKKKIELDIELSPGSDKYAIELKYKTKSSKNYEHLKNQSATPGARCDFWLDYVRIGELIKHCGFSGGCVIFLTNVSSYWEKDKKECYSAAEFSLAPRKIDKGTFLKWSGGEAPKWAGEKRKQEIKLDNEIELKWEKYLDTPEKFQYLLVER